MVSLIVLASLFAAWRYLMSPADEGVSRKRQT